MHEKEIDKIDHEIAELENQKLKLLESRVGSIGWARAMARKGYHVTNSEMDRGFYNYFENGNYYYGIDRSRRISLMPAKPNSCMLAKGRPATGWSLIDGASVDEGPPNTPSVYGLKLLRPNYTSLTEQYPSVEYRENEWTRVPGLGAFVAVRDGVSSGIFSYTAKNVSRNFKLVVLECRELLDENQRSGGIELYRWVRRLPISEIPRARKYLASEIFESVLETYTSGWIGAKQAAVVLGRHPNIRDPKAGEVWKHVGENAIWLRVSPAPSNNKVHIDTGVFISVCLDPGDGEWDAGMLEYTMPDCGDILVLGYAEEYIGVEQFEEALAKYDDEILET